MRRIGLATILALSFVLAPLTPAAPQQAGKVWHLGVLSPSNAPSEAARRQSPLIQKLNELGYAENRNLSMEYRYADGKIDRLADLAIELVQSNVDAIFTFSTPGVQAARKATGTIPIVFIGINDPVGLGLVASLAHPGGNVTGISTLLTGDLAAKQLQILQEVVPRVSRVATLWNPANPASATALKETQAIAPALGIRIVPVAMQTPGELEIAVATVLRDRADALLVHPTAPMVEQRSRLLDFALKNRLPTVSGIREFAAAGALMTYGPVLARDVRTAAMYLDKIFKGAKPADLPVEQPTQLELVINLKTAKALGVTISQALLPAGQRGDPVAVLDQRGQRLRAAVGFATCSLPSYDRALHALRTWLDSWAGIGHVAVGMHRQCYDLQLTQYDDRGWRATFYYTTRMEHSPTSATGTVWEPTPWHQTQRVAWEALTKAETNR